LLIALRAANEGGFSFTKGRQGTFFELALTWSLRSRPTIQLGNRYNR
jgi:hypothetical protein